MGGALAFGCPECGRRIDLAERSPGRRVRCGRCGTLVEVPFFPRQFGRRHLRRRRWKLWLRVGLIVAATFGTAAIAWQGWRASVRSGQSDALGRALAALEAAERGEDPSEALAAAEEARALALRHGLGPPGGLEGLAARRDEHARRDAEARLSALETLPADRAFEEARALFARVGSDPALAVLAGRSARALAGAAGRWVDRGLARAERTCESSRPAESLGIAERLAEGLDTLPPATAAGALGRVRSFAGDLIEWRGARITAVVSARIPRGEGAAPYEADLPPPLREALADRGYLVMTPGSPLAGLWDRAPFTLDVTIAEQDGPRYLQSAHRTTRIRVDLALDRDGRTTWAEYLEARTRAPMPGLGALESSRLALGGQPSPAVERRFYDDARLDLLERLRLKLRALPPAPDRVR